VKKKVIVSKCLLGDVCRYDGKVKKSQEVCDALNEYDIIPFCPEDPLFGTPRERISVHKIANEHKIITDETNKDVTQQLKDEILSFLEINKDIKDAILKAKSPSCGYKTTPVLDEHKNVLYYGNGIAVDIFLEKGLSIKDENSYKKM